jgi:hypothetical protein
MAVKICPPHDREFVIQRLIADLPAADSFVRAEARACLAENFSFAQPQVEAEIARRRRAGRREQALDVVLRMLVNLEWEMEGHGAGRE